MRHRILVVAAAVFASACGIAEKSSTITEPQRPTQVVRADVPSCPATLTFAEVEALLLAVYQDGSPDENAALSKLNNLQQHLSNGNLAQAKERAWDLAAFTITKRDQGKLVGTEADLIAFLNALFCYAGLGPYFSENSFFIYPNDNAQIILAEDGWAGVSIPANNVAEPTLLTITRLDDTLKVLTTDLDQYPLNYDFSIYNSGGTGWINPVIVGVCPPSNLNSAIKQRLLLGHQEGSTFELLPSADASFIDCSDAPELPSSSLLRLSSTQAEVDSTVALEVIGSAGVGGATDNFSPIAPVDPNIYGSAGAGGTADNFRPRGGAVPALSLGATTLANVSCTPLEALIGTEIEAACRPNITFHTGLGTALDGIPIAWSVESGGGTIATPVSDVCAPNSFSSSLSQNTDANGLTRICWKLGLTPGTNTVVATAGLGGDAIQGVNFVYSEGGAPDEDAIKIRFTATGVRLTPGVTATSDSSTYDGQPHGGSGTCDPTSLTPAMSYDTQDGNAPVNAGTYTLTVTCGSVGDPDDIYMDATATATITITPASSSTVVSCPASVTYNGTAQTPCTATATGAGGLNTTLAVTYSNNTSAGTATASASYAGDANHNGSNGSTTFQIAKASATATAGSATILFGAAVPTIPCTVTGLVAGDAGAVTCTTSASYTTAGVFPTVPVISPSNPPDYSVALVNGQLTVLGYVQVGCFSAPIYNVMPTTKSAQKKGSNLPVKCTLQWPNGSPVSNATGGLVVYDLGPNPLGTNPTPPAGAPTLPIPNAFTPTANGNYSHALNTSGTFYVVGNAYFIRATWSDGSTTTGYFRIK